MNIKEYISSGVLEAFVLGQLSREERAAVENNLEQYPELREELAQIEWINESMLVNLGVEPPASLKEKVIAAVQANGRLVKMEPSFIWRYAAAASIALVLLSSYLAYDYRAKWKSAEVALNNLIAQNQQIARDYNQVNKRLDKVENDLRIIDNPTFMKVVMKGTVNAPESMASVYWNEQTKEVYLSVQNLRDLSKDNQYQLWAIIDGKPVDAGVFDSNLAGLIKMKEITKGAATFAVTVEPHGGRPSPSLETMQVAGNVAKG